jgi:hypothetical protein
VFEEESDPDGSGVVGLVPPAGVDDVDEMLTEFIVDEGVGFLSEGMVIQTAAEEGWKPDLEECFRLGGYGESGLEELVVRRQGHGFLELVGVKIVFLNDMTFVADREDETMLHRAGRVNLDSNLRKLNLKLLMKKQVVNTAIAWAQTKLSVRL